MSSLPLADYQCFYVAILVFIVIGFQRGWRRELVTLVFVLLGFFLLISPSSSKTFFDFLARLPGVLAYLFSGSAGQSSTAAPSFNFLGQWGSLLLFAIVVGLGYYVGNKAFPKPNTPSERFIGVIPALISGAFIIGFVNVFMKAGAQTSGPSNVTVAIQTPDPATYLPVILVIAIVAAVIALIAARAKKPAPKK